MNKIYTLFASILLGTTFHASQSYAQCIPTFSDGCDQGTDINDFIISGEESTGINDNNSYCSPGSYYNNTSSASISLAAGSSYSATISTMYSEPGDGSYAVIWIDLNEDGIFSESERVATSTSIISTSGTSISFSIPSGTEVGNKTMRVMLGYAMGEDGLLISPSTFTPCNDGSNPLTMGEVHDYLINVIPNPLPVGLTNLNAISNGNHHEITWKTVSENNNLKFNVLYSFDGVQFDKIGEVASKANNGNSNETIDYKFVAPVFNSKIAYYQLEQVDINGKVSKSSVVKVESSNNQTSFILSPNPVKNLLNIQSLYNNISNVEVSIFNVTGNKVMTTAINSIESSINIDHLPAGMYFAQFVDNGSAIENIKFIKE